MKKTTKKKKKPVETFRNEYPDRDFEISIVNPEYTSVCPRTGLPDFGTVIVTYVPDRHCLELKSLKLYYLGYRNEGIFYEEAVNRILDDLVASCDPRWMSVRGEFTSRGGMRSTVETAYVREE
jgi:7-cyano-7-deazaguanine reductase